MTLPLDGVTVLDFTWAQAGPLATLMLADMGADVIKVESPRGDLARTVSPFPGGVSSVFTALNRGKQSIVVDLREPGGRDVIARLARQADVVVENFAPGTMARLGCGPDDLMPLNKRLIYASCSGFGQRDPGAAPAFDLVIQAISGVMMVTGDPGSGPTRVGYSSADFGGATFLLIAIMQALLERHRTGRGTRVETSMIDAQVAALWDVYNEYMLTGHAPEKLGSRHAPAAPFQAFATADGHVVVTVVSDDMFADLCRALGRPALAADARFSANSERVANVLALQDELAGVFAELPTADAVERLSRARVPVAPVHDTAGAVEHTPYVQRMALDLGDLGHVVGTPLMREGEYLAQPRRPPALGEHTEEVLRRFEIERD